MVIARKSLEILGIIKPPGSIDGQMIGTDRAATSTSPHLPEGSLSKGTSTAGAP
jgi:hypothetical protein